MITTENIRDILDYDPETGVFLWRARPAKVGMAGWNGRCAGKNASKLDRTGYSRISINRKSYYAHRLAWLYVHGDPGGMTVDHINGVQTDNRIANLRLATNAQQKANCGIRKTNTSGYKGVSWSKASGKWRAKINANGSEYMLGYFADPKAAYAAYVAAAHKHHGDFARIA